MEEGNIEILSTAKHSFIEVSELRRSLHDAPVHSAV